MPGPLQKSSAETKTPPTHSAEAMLVNVYQELRKLAAHQLRSKGPHPTLQATALVHEAYLRLRNSRSSWDGEGHFFVAAATSIRRLIVEHAREKKTQKRGGLVQIVPLHNFAVGKVSDHEPLAEWLDQQCGTDASLRSAVERTVALKMVKPGMDSREMLRRFQWEQAVLARLEHPNIARLLDAGQTPDGRPYFVMEFVRGKPLIEFCNQQRWTIDQRMRLFEMVCSAIRLDLDQGDRKESVRTL